MSLRRYTLVASILGSLALASSAEASSPTMSRQEILALGKSVVGYSYWWGNAAWDPSNLDFPGECHGAGCPSCTHTASSGGPEYGADCSGLIGHAWGLAGDSPKENSHPYSTKSFYFEKTHWSDIDMSDLMPGDAVVHNDGSSGHIRLFEKWASDGSASFFECSGCSSGCQHSTVSISSAYKAIRRENVDSQATPVHPGGELLQADCGGITGWATSGDDPVDVVLSFDGPSGAYYAKRQVVKADQDGECGEEGACGNVFDAPFPEVLADGKRHRLYAYSVDPESGDEKLLIGAPVVLRCKATTTSASGCSHAECDAGAALDSECSSCTAAVCLTRPSCCAADGDWDTTCVDLVGDSVGACSGACAGGNSTCKHDECEEGVGLTSKCSDCAEHVCQRDQFCCSDKWDWICANEAEEDPFCSCK